MKGQDIGVMLRLVCLQKHEARDKVVATWPHDWRDWHDNEEDAAFSYQPDFDLDDMSPGASYYTARALEEQTGISKSQIALALKHCVEIGLARVDVRSQLPRVNTQALLEFLVYGLRFVFPARYGELTRGIATGFAAPVLSRSLISSGEHIPVWPYARGKTMGMKVEPLFKTAVLAARKDPEMYALLALVDSIRVGQPRERNLAIELLRERLEMT
ncbi:hypothetical protein [Pseudomonas oryzihabitans]|uniref:hypothetical protein n=1 Tax=Pseudomonas oryzihabitans TaxID=47885 RepID=UPI00362DCBD5